MTPLSSDRQENTETGNRLQMPAQREFATGLATGSLSKLCFNNLNKSISNYQLGAPKILDHSFTTMRGQLIGAGMQGLGLFATKAALQRDDQSTSERTAANMAAGAVGGLLMSPACVPFFYKPAEALRTGVAPITTAMFKVFQKEPSVFARGLLARGLCTALEFGTYFSLKEEYQKSTGQQEVDLTKKAAFALPAIVMAMPFHQVYIQQMNTGESLSAALKRFVQQDPTAATGNRHRVCLGLFIASAMGELMVIDALKKAIDSVIDAR